MIYEVCDCDVYASKNELSGFEPQQRDLTNLFQAATENIKCDSPVKPLMAGCTRDVTLGGYYKDKHGNEYGGSITISGGKDSEESDELVSDYGDGPDPRDREYD